MIKCFADFFDIKKNRFLGIEYLKVFLAIYYKGFSWVKELENEFNITNKVIKKAIEVLEEEHLITSRDFWNLEIFEQEAIKKLNAGYFSKINSYPKLYVVSKEGEEIFDLYKDEIKDLLDKFSTLKITIDFIKQKKKAYEILKNENKKKEENLEYVKRYDDKTNVLYYVQTKKQIEFRKKIKEISRQLKNDDKKFLPKNNIVVQKQIKKTQKTYTDKKGQNEDEIMWAEYVRQREIETILDLNQNSSKEITKEKKDFFENLIKKIKDKKRVSYLEVKRQIKNEKDFIFFIQNYLEKNKILIDEDFDFFIYRKI